MSCIDAAIIKALVEHIGGNPDEVTGSDSWTTMEQSRSLVPTTVSVGDETLVCLEQMGNVSYPSIGARLYIEDTDGSVYSLVLVEQSENNMTFRGILREDGNDSFEKVTLTKAELEGKVYYVKQSWSTDSVKLDTMRICTNDITNYNDPLVIKMLLRHCCTKLNIIPE